MIHPSPDWRYVEAIIDRGYFEDDVVEHGLTRHLAVRRAFSEKFMGDEVAVKEVRDQARLAASIWLPSLPRVYQMEEVEGRLTLVMELRDGRSFVDLSRMGSFRPEAKWLFITRRLVDELLQLRNHGIRIDRLKLEHIALTDDELICFVQRWPIGSPPKEVKTKSPYLQRLLSSNQGGVYVSKRPPNEYAEINALKEILIKMATGLPEQTFDGALDDAKRQSQEFLTQTTSSLAGVEPGIAEILLGMDTGSSGTGKFLTLRSLANELDLQSEQTGDRQLLGGATIAPFAAEPPFASQKQDDFEPPPRHPSAPLLRTEPVMDEESPAEADSSPISPPPSPRPASRSSRSSASDTEIRRSASPTSLKDEELSYERLSHTEEAEDDDVSYLYPTRKSDSTPVTGEKKLASASADGQAARSSGASIPPVPKVHKIRKPFPWKLLAGLVFTLLVISGLVMGFIAFMNRPNGVNQPPVAHFSIPDRPIRQQDTIVLDAGASTDPEGQTLRYTWNVISPQDAEVIIAPNDTPEAKTPQVQFLTSGDITIQLTVWDGRLVSEPVRKTIHVGPFQR